MKKIIFIVLILLVISDFFMKKIVIVLAIVVVLMLYYENKDNKIVIPDTAIRLRVIPNSNSKEDIMIKNEVIKEVSKYFINGSIDDVRNNIHQTTHTTYCKTSKNRSNKQ